MRPIISELFEWRTITYRTIILWGLLILTLAGAGGYWYYNRYIANKTSEPIQDPGPVKRAAHFSSLDGDIRVKRLSGIEWSSAEMDRLLYPGDMIKTGTNSSCRVTFFDGTVYEVKPNSLISILESAEEKLTMTRRVNVGLSSGSLDLATPSRNVPTSTSTLETSTIVAKPGENTKAAASYNERSGSMTLRINQGTADVSSKLTRDRVTVGANEQAEIQQKTVSKRQIPPPPFLVSPRPSEPYSVASLKNFSIELVWSADPPANAYHLQVSTQPQFYTPIVDVTLRSTTYALRNLTYGTYYWRVQARNTDGIDGLPSSTGSFAVFKQSAPVENVRFDIEKIVPMGEHIEIIGKTDPGNMATINGKPVFQERNGSFRHFEPIGEVSEIKLEIQVKDNTGAIRRISKTIKLE